MSRVASVGYFETIWSFGIHVASIGWSGLSVEAKITENMRKKVIFEG